ncbi:MAG: baseplate J/gp47 family protein [Firmicutes bacterium]|nr:baseplate J/gp47 family protein [Bacillota bacterium]
MIQFVEIDSQKIFDEMILSIQKALKEVLYPGDERRIFLEQQLQVIVAIYNSINESAKQNLLRYAKDDILDAIGESKDTPRLQAKKSSTMVRFTLSEIRQLDTEISRNTRVTPDGVIFFETVEEGIISSGDTYIDLEVVATIAGENHNGFTPGQINKLVDSVPFISEVSNLTTSNGGRDVEPDDDGENVWSGYRERIRLSSSKISTAGHENGYIYWAKTADADIQDVVPTSPNPGEVLITVVMKEGNIPSQGILDKIEQICSGKTVRPMTDKVVAAGPTEINYDISLTYYIGKENEQQENEIKSKVNAAIDEYKSWQNAKIGREINPDKLRQLIFNAGANRAELNAPIYLDIGETEIAKLGATNIVYGGLE